VTFEQGQAPVKIKNAFYGCKLASLSQTFTPTKPLARIRNTKKPKKRHQRMQHPLTTQFD
jgi:hypothetical protein